MASRATPSARHATRPGTGAGTRLDDPSSPAGPPSSSVDLLLRGLVNPTPAEAVQVPSFTDGIHQAGKPAHAFLGNAKLGRRIRGNREGCRDHRLHALTLRPERPRCQSSDSHPTPAARRSPRSAHQGTPHIFPTEGRSGNRMDTSPNVTAGGGEVEVAGGGSRASACLRSSSRSSWRDTSSPLGGVVGIRPHHRRRPAGR